jgi:ribosome-associated toxin RatA of RatAB toxin-antitoxin module
MDTQRAPIVRVATHPTTRALWVLCILGAAAPAPAEARAIRAVLVTPPAPAPPAVVYAVSPADAPRTVRVAMAGSSLVQGRSTIVIAASLEKVRETVDDFAHYADFMPHYRKCKVLGRTAAGGRDVYMEVKAINGLMTMWARVEAEKPTTVDGVEIHQTKFVAGNIKDLRATWRLRKIDAASTEVTLDVFLLPSFPLPDKLVNSENLSGSADAVLAVRKRITGK